MSSLGQKCTLLAQAGFLNRKERSLALFGLATSGVFLLQHVDELAQKN